MEGNEAFRQRFARPGRPAIVFKSNMRDVAHFSNFMVLGTPIRSGIVGPQMLDFATVEHYYQAAKAIHIALPAYAELIRLAETPLQAKKLGGGASMSKYVDNNSDALPEALAIQIRPILTMGDKRKREAAIKGVLKSNMGGFDHANVMRKALRLKFDPARDAALVQLLLATGDAELGESRGRGENLWAINKAGDAGLLGTLLMERRRELLAH